MRSDVKVGQTLGHYRIIRPVGYGGMATVFLAQDIHLQREVAIKVFLPTAGETEDFLHRFAREARVLAQLDHPNILLVHDYGEQHGLAYLVMPYMRGGSLKELLQAHRILPIPEAIRLISQILNALQYAHQQGLIHRDIKPDNMLFKADGTLLLSDFGLVKVLSVGNSSLVDDVSQTDQTIGRTPQCMALVDDISQAGQMIAGTPQYMAPEQIKGQATPQSDIYSVGVVLYELLTGVCPFMGENAMVIWMKHLYEQPRPLCEINPKIPPQLEAVVLQTLEKDATKRYQQPIDLLQALMPGGPVNVLSTPTSLPPPSAIATSRYGESGPVQSGVTAIPMTPSLDEHFSVPTQPLRWRSPFKLIMALVMVSVLTVVGLALFPVGLSWLDSHPGPTPTSSVTHTTTGNHPIPTVTTAPVPSTQTSCPAAATARAAVVAPLALGDHQSIVYVVNTGPFDLFGGAGLGTLKRYDVNIGLKTEIVKIAHKAITHAQVSADGQWILFTTVSQAASGLASEAIQMVRMDGHGLQTLYCASEGDLIVGIQWSPDQKSLVFSEQLVSAANHSPTTVYLLHMVTGQLQTMVYPPNNYDTPVVGYVPVTWLDSTRVYMTDVTSQGRFQNLYLLNTQQTVTQQNGNLQIVATMPQLCWDFDSSLDGTRLFLSQCTKGNGPSSVRLQAVTGGSQQTIYNSRTLAVIGVRVISGTELLLLIENGSGDQSQNGLWKITTDGSDLTRLTIDTDGSQQLNQASQYPWSNISRDGSMYALQKSSSLGKAYTLIFGVLGGTPVSFASTSDGTQLAIAGWTTM